MGTAMRPLAEFSDSERELIIELLERERRDLGPEIRRTETPDMHDTLRARLEVVERLLNRVRPAA